MNNNRNMNSINMKTVIAFTLAILISSSVFAQEINYINLVGRVYQHHLYKNSGGSVYEPRVFLDVYDIRTSATTAAGNQSTWFTCLTGCTNTTNILGCSNGSPIMIQDISLGSGNHVEIWECPDHVRGHCAGMTGFVNFYGGLGDVMKPIMLTLGFDESWCE